jgi:phosphopantetheine adenylyltransferase
VYDFTCVGGTFDHLHSGHKVLLTGSALITNKKLTIGLSGALQRATNLICVIVYFWCGYLIHEDCFA